MMSHRQGKENFQRSSCSNFQTMNQLKLSLDDIRRELATTKSILLASPFREHLTKLEVAEKEKDKEVKAKERLKSLTVKEKFQENKTVTLDDLRNDLANRRETRCVEEESANELKNTNFKSDKSKELISASQNQDSYISLAEISKKQNLYDRVIKRKTCYSPKLQKKSCEYTFQHILDDVAASSSPHATQLHHNLDLLRRRYENPASSLNSWKFDTMSDSWRSLEIWEAEKNMIIACLLKKPLD